MTSKNHVLRILLVIAVSMTAVVLSACGSTADPASEPSAEQTGAPTADETTPPEPTEVPELYTPAYKPNGRETAVFTTSKGDITVEFYGEDAPIHVGSFIELAKKGFFDGTKFHRYVADFVIQGGDPTTKDSTSEQVAAADGDPYSPFGKSGPGYNIKGEFDPAVNPKKHIEGALGMARSQSPDSAGSQFYFAINALPQLDGSYTVFGRITKGMDVMKSLRAGDVLEKVEIVGATD